MTDAERTKLEQRLLEERQRATDAIRQLDEEVRDDAEQGGDLTNYPLHMADRGSEAIEEETDLLLMSNEGRRLYEIDRALRKLYRDPETFGMCEQCGADIALERLDLVPWATLCADCQRAAEESAEGPAG